jgi:hypothetical protein
LNEGEKLAVLLQEALPEIREESLASYARALAYTMAQERKQAHERSQNEAALSHDSEVLIEPLSEQEQRVLRLLAGCRTRDCQRADYLDQYCETHLKNIMEALATSRDQARKPPAT